jgi:hypothetical protein
MIAAIFCRRVIYINNVTPPLSFRIFLGVNGIKYSSSTPENLARGK